ncbi:ribonuclease [Pararhizobium sp. YC-54]|uniref:ribonuclease T2 family protein n=1 Tax=Pararhizobium sp. YC-54 TaxID=2986920 RepID=UPI0021F6D43B|nr:ribonuclease [Pararhizobium sp. YC-54]MCV9997539.1 ribonuclease [Pararhizobium sp. YC-54]
MLSGLRGLIVALVGLLALAACSGEEKTPQARKDAPASSTATANTPIIGTPATGTLKKPQAVPLGSGFDFYVLSLSWSPSWCLENDPSGRSMQCDPDNNHGFIVHGLWPQNEQGFPEFCRTRDPDRVPETLGRPLFDIMPSMGLIGHEWRKHGSCSGLSQKDYFTVLRAAREKVTIPPGLQSVGPNRKTSATDIETALTSANPGLRPDALAVTCASGRVDEVRICFDKDLSFRTCGEIDRAGCKVKSLSLPATP